MQRVSLDEVWNRVVARAGETFTQVRGGEFTYEVDSNLLHLDRTNQAISRSQLGEALELVPLKSTTVVQHLRAPSYLYAILTDTRIREDDW
ncbi:hypothetical protein [Actinomarinicola tropica]|uniref:Uncharacterized protein n=1 Tax=Actinomarinicola tropica TaxID=2789776 RepID=A0A5Q2RKJ4_9ACTN|nr:hypothetical protein [Actinomarinicola tropica]QGG94380.1 hypothetical protein GH723_04270 [Actinomarinicola tropica]